MFEKFREQREKRREYLKELIHEDKEIREQRIKSRAEILTTILKNNKDNPCVKETYNMEKLSEFVSDENKSLGMKRTIAIVVTVGYLLTTMIIIGRTLFPIEFLFKIYMVLAFIASSVILSYFYTSYKMNNLFKML